MLAVNHLEKVTWRRAGAPQAYLGYLTTSDSTIRLAGREAVAGIDTAIAIPREAIRTIRASASDQERVAGEPSIVLELTDGVPIVLRPVGLGDLRTEILAGRLRRLVAPARRRAS